MKHLIVIAVLTQLSIPAGAADGDPRVVLETSKGKIVVELHPGKAPKTVENFLAYVDSGFYDGTLFHRVIPGFMIQGGGFGPDMKRKATRPPITNEADNGLKNLRGTLSMARTGDPNSATAQFFLSVADNDNLDHTSKTSRGWGPVLVEYWGGTEGGVNTLVDSLDWRSRPGTVGRTLPAFEVFAVGDDGVRLPAGEVGTLYCRDSRAQHPFEYHGDPAKTPR